jgi:tetratricopeptide (TPR) repeat protein
VFNRILVAIAILCIAVSARGAKFEQFDMRINSELQMLAPAAVPLWQAANAARKAGNHEEAIRLYGEVYARAPRFSHALRRMAGEELAAGRHAAALKVARRAVAVTESGENVGMVALVLISPPVGESSGDAKAEATQHVRRAMQLSPDDPYVYSVAAQVATVTDDLDLLRTAATRLETLDADEPSTHVYLSILAASDGRWSDARAALDRARALGLPQEAYDGLRSQYDAATPFYLRWWKPAAIALAIWFGVFALLLAAASLLSRAALRAIQEAPQQPGGTVDGLSSNVRRAYAAVLWLCCVFYYASIPLVMLSVIAIAGALLYATFAFGHVPIKLVLFIVIIAGVSVWSMAKSLFIRATDEDPGTRLDLAREPKLRAFLDEVADRIGTRAVDNVYLTPGTDLAVMERGKGSTKERCLILGVATLDGFGLMPFKAVLGHEYGHFTNRDTAGGAFALSVRNSMRVTAIGLIQGGAADWYNPAWLFVNGFNKVFLRISEGASRLQEVLADRWAAFSYGADAFERGLRHVVERSVRFDAHVGVTLKEVVDGQVPLANLYTYTPAAATDDLTSAIEASLNREASAYDSHPSPAERFALVHALPAVAADAHEDDGAQAWSLFSDPSELQRAMTNQVRENVRVNYGVEIVAPAMA